MQILSRLVEVLRLLTAVFTVILVGCTAATSQESGQQCDVSGSTSLWAMSFCMSILATDDEAHPDVMGCYLGERDALTDSNMEENCSLNLAYKSAICRPAVENGRFEGSLVECVKSDDTIPRIVESGGV